MNQEQKTNSHINIFNGDVSDIQIQQGTKNSTQTKNVNNGFDYDTVGKIIEQIKQIFASSNFCIRSICAKI